MFIAALFSIAKLWNQPRGLTTDEWIKKMWYLYTVEFYSATKKNEILSFTGKCMELELENIILSEVIQVQKAKSHSFSLMCELRPNTNVTIVWNMGHAKGRSHTREGGYKTEVNVNVVDVLSIQE
jgi:hypothetical protein